MQKPGPTPSGKSSGAEHARVVEVVREGDDLVLDLANHSSSKGIAHGYTIPADLTIIDFTNNRLKVIENLTHLTCLKRLSFRQNLLERIEGLGDALSTLTELDFHANSIEQIQNIAGRFPNLTHLDLSFNSIRGIEGLEHLPCLRELYLEQNKLHRIENLQSLTSLTLLELGGNRIREIEGLSSLVQLRSLYLGKNKLDHIKELEGLTRLELLSLQSNRLTRLCGLERLTSLTELYVGSNGLTAIEGLNTLTRLRVLDLSMNQIKRLQNLEPLHALEEFWLNSNGLSDFRDLELLRNATRLNTIYLEANPLQQDSQYANKILATLSGITQLDALPVSNPPIARLLRGKVGAITTPAAKK